MIVISDSSFRFLRKPTSLSLFFSFFYCFNEKHIFENSLKKIKNSFELFEILASQALNLSWYVWHKKKRVLNRHRFHDFIPCSSEYRLDQKLGKTKQNFRLCTSSQLKLRNVVPSILYLSKSMIFWGNQNIGSSKLYTWKQNFLLVFHCLLLLIRFLSH